MPHDSTTRPATGVDLQQTLSEIVGPQAARRLLRESSSLTVLGRAPAARLQQMAGLSATAARRLKASFQLTEALMQDRLPVPFKIERTSDVAHLMREHFRLLTTEELHVILVDAGNHFLRDVRVTPGSVTSQGIAPAKIFQPAFEFNAAALILVHNHPSNHLTPSALDLQSTRQIYEMGRALQVPLLDHVIMGTRPALASSIISPSSSTTAFQIARLTGRRCPSLDHSSNASSRSAFPAPYRDVGRLRGWGSPATCVRAGLGLRQPSRADFRR